MRSTCLHRLLGRTRRDNPLMRQRFVRSFHRYNVPHVQVLPHASTHVINRRRRRKHLERTTCRRHPTQQRIRYLRRFGRVWYEIPIRLLRIRTHLHRRRKCSARLQQRTKHLLRRLVESRLHSRPFVMPNDLVKTKFVRTHLLFTWTNLLLRRTLHSDELPRIDIHSQCSFGRTPIEMILQRRRLWTMVQAAKSILQLAREQRHCKGRTGHATGRHSPRESSLRPMMRMYTRANL